MTSDVHFGSPAVDQGELADAFASTIFPLIPELDVIFINGDLFDRAVPFDGLGFDPFYTTAMNLMTLCHINKVALRVLQGTFSHDRHQPKRLESFYRNTGYTFDFKVMEGIQFETLQIRDRSLRLLYLQDDLPYKSSGDIVEVVQEKMVELGWDYVDYACMHGFFDFTFPQNVSQDNVIVFKEAQFPFVRKIIDVGHVHQHRISGNVISNGSFDRLCFGDEGPKGCVKVLDYPDHYTAQFILNEKAAIFDTLKFARGESTEILSQRIIAHMVKIHSDRKISLRFEVETLEHREAIRALMREVYPHVRGAFKKPTDKSGQEIALLNSPLISPLEKRVAPTLKTIGAFIRNHIPESYQITIDEIEAYLDPAVG